MAVDYLSVDYFSEALSSIAVVASRPEVPLHSSQCRFLASKLSVTRSSLEAKVLDLQGVLQSDDVRRTALRQLHFALKRAEILVRNCCCEVETSWLESAVTLAQIREDIVDILLDVRWWMSMVDIAVASVRWVGSQELKLLRQAENGLKVLGDQLQARDNDLDKAVADNNQELLKRVREVQDSHASRVDHDYLLATHVRTRLEKTDLSPSTAEGLNKYSYGPVIGCGGFGAVMMVKWLNRHCALKQLNLKCTKEAATLAAFQHPHIVQFLRYWEAPFPELLGRSPTFSAMAMPNDNASDTSSSESNSENSYILMEFLPTDLQKHLAAITKNAALRARVSSRKPLGAPASISAATPMTQDAAIDVMLQVAKAMCYLNSKDVGHRNLKPRNILVRPVSAEETPELAACGYVRVKLGDFGMVKTAASSTAFSTLPKNMGRTIYGSPEVFTKDNGPPMEPRYPRLADVWSFGIMFSEVLTGKTPFGEENRLTELHALIRQQGLRPELPTGCPEYLKFCITQCWQLRPQDRPNFTDLPRLLRFAQARSLGIIREDHDLFTFVSKDRVEKRLHRPPPAATDPKPNSFFFRFWRIAQLFIKSVRVKRA